MGSRKRAAELSGVRRRPTFDFPHDPHILTGSADRLAESGSGATARSGFHPSNARAVSSVGFPLRAAAVDIGSNAMRLLVADFAAPDRFTVVETSRVPVRLGSGAFGRPPRIDEETIDAAVAAGAGFRRRLDELGVHVVRAVATSALRESENGSEVRRRIADACGLEVEAITGSEEARLVWLAVRTRLPQTNRRWYLADLGGGSLEIVRSEGDRIGWSESYPIGTVRLLR
jgi:exopolyphosphatase / guanosine-5'-triphosphate,3'-diphosphate pyrophosphatase